MREVVQSVAHDRLWYLGLDERQAWFKQVPPRSRGEILIVARALTASLQAETAHKYTTAGLSVRRALRTAR